jgi:CubicO group peptidase (beta-lactamase class C family)
MSEWPTAPPESQGLDAARLGLAADEVRTRFRSSHSLLVVRHGHLVLEEYFHGTGSEDLQRLACVSKSVISALVGIALAQGQIANLGDRLLDYFPEYDDANLPAATREITLRHLLTNTTGWYWPHRRRDSGGGDEAMIERWFRSRNYVDFLLRLPVREKPGAVFSYNGACSWLLSAILDRRTPAGMLAFSEEHLFAPLGIRATEWERDPQGQHLLGWGLRLRPRDAAKFGQLYLQNGFWAGRQVVPAAWVAESTQGHTGAYGYLWWLGSADGCRRYCARGGRGSLIEVVPDLDLVVVITCQSSTRDPSHVVNEFLVSAVRNTSSLC